jgi:hypothetical protein
VVRNLVIKAFKINFIIYKIRSTPNKWVESKLQNHNYKWENERTIFQYTRDF